jgi:DNA-binding transcriptional LysR family regulator
LTPQGQVLLAQARTVVSDVDVLKAQAKTLAGGLEAELSVVVEVMFPMARLTAAVTAFHAAFPLTPLRLYVEALGAVIQPVLDGRCTLAISGELVFVPPQFSQESLLQVPLVHVASPEHPLARRRGPISSSELAKHVQLVLTDRSALSRGQEFGVLSPRTWRLADLGAKHAFLLAGLGWGGMPAELIESDLARGTLVKILVADAPARGYELTMRAVYPAEAPPGIAARWFIDRLKQGSQTRSPVRKRLTRTKRA